MNPTFTNQKLSFEQVELIRVFRGPSDAEFAEMFGVTRLTILRARLGQTFHNVTIPVRKVLTKRKHSTTSRRTNRTQ